MTLMTMSSLTLTIYAQAKTDSSGQSKKPVVIESQVKGSQEQPKVLYIMPWQGITNPIALSDKEMQVQLPDFRPIHPKSFQQQVSEFNEQQAQVKE
ncbi:hypothetical protein [Shewanella gelidii]|uniref:hypothetical protein n=1 Tax=Shewanella gelidii TaxID=1642821 RepID=UPI001663B163|nr:hypothetical protein [Shewanella gelidii]MCL1099202.1 hypothetical protein [Shewanella gelidii]